MLSQQSSLISIDQLSSSDVEILFKVADRLNVKIIPHASQKLVVAMVFAEPSTRTRLSFEMACHRLGLLPIILDNPSSSSLAKGESFTDTLLNVAALRPDLVIVRCAEAEASPQVLTKLGCPVISAGVGVSEHPTQALLDAYTIVKNLQQVAGQKVLFIGDVAFSRVANSNLKLLSLMGAEVAYCAPEGLTPVIDLWKSVQRFTSLKEGLAWASVVIGLRLQRERHGSPIVSSNELQTYQLNHNSLKLLNQQAIVLHPGPVLWGQEFAAEVSEDPRCRILQQVSSGVVIRAAIMAKILGLEVAK